MYNETGIYLSRALLPSRAMVAKQEQVKRTKGISLKKMIKWFMMAIKWVEGSCTA